MIKLPAPISKDMQMWRLGLTGMPKSYIKYHEEIANYDLAHRKWKVISKTLEDDGWGDGAKFVVVVVETAPGQFARYKWSESGAWFRQSSAWIREHEMLPATSEFVAEFIRMMER